MSSPAAKTHRRHLSGFSSNASSFSSRGSSASSRYRERLSTTNSDARSSGSYLSDHLSLSQQPSNLSTFSNRSNLRTPCKDLVSAFSSQTSLQSNYMVKPRFLLIVYFKALIKLELAKYYKDSEMTAFISERSRNSK